MFWLDRQHGQKTRRRAVCSKILAAQSKDRVFAIQQGKVVKTDRRGQDNERYPRYAWQYVIGTI